MLKRKILTLIVILIGLGSFFHVSLAADPVGRCVTDKNTYINVSKAACDLVAKNTGEVVKSWNSNDEIKKAEEVEKRKYELLAPISKDFTSFDPEQTGALGAYLNLMIKIFIGICAVFAVVMIVIGGIEYMTTELISGKEDGKKRITEALLGLLLALFAYALLYTINPNLLKTDFNPNTTNGTGAVKDSPNNKQPAPPTAPPK